MNLKQAVGLVFHNLFDRKTVFNPITRKLYPELYEYKGGRIEHFIIKDHGLGKSGNYLLFIYNFQSQYPSLKRKG